MMRLFFTMVISGLLLVGCGQSADTEQQSQSLMEPTGEPAATAAGEMGTKLDESEQAAMETAQDAEKGAQEASRGVEESTPGGLDRPPQ